MKVIVALINPPVWEMVYTTIYTPRIYRDLYWTSGSQVGNSGIGRSWRFRSLHDT